MASITRTVTVQAPVDTVYRYLDDPTHLPEFWPSLVAVSDVHSLPNGGHAYDWKYKMVGIPLEGESEDIEHVENERIVSKTTGGISSTETWTLAPRGDQTEVTMKIDYSVPVPVLGKLAEAAIVKLNEHEGDVTMANLKTMLEAA